MLSEALLCSPIGAFPRTYTLERRSLQVTYGTVDGAACLFGCRMEWEGHGCVTQHQLCSQHSCWIAKLSVIRLRTSTKPT
eukprot:7409015-Prorocentrum_lima.AAC.1